VIRLLLHQTRYDLLTFIRNRQARFFTVLLPVIFLLIFASVFGKNLIGAEHVRASTYYVPGIAALAVLAASFSNLVIAVTGQRELGILKRRRATPVPAGVVIAGRAVVSLVVSLVVTVVVITIGAMPLSFISGVYIRSVQLSPVLRHVAQAFPLQHLVAALSRGFLPGSTGVAWPDLAILAAWGLCGFLIALTRFRWSPAAAQA
jgi:ABC-2 type transport system permease protein